MRLMRSVLFVPGHRESWPAKAVASGADGVILDLEDSVPLAMKEEARHIVAASIRELARGLRKIGIYVRLNALESGLSGDDIEKVAIPGLDGFVLPKTYGERDIIEFDALVTHYERRNGVEPGTIEFILSMETAQAYAACERMIAASPRVATLFAGTAKDADVSRSIGFQFTPEGLETLYLRSRALLAVRAAGLQFPIVGLWQDLNDPEGMRRFTEQNRQLGFRGQVLIHPSHVAVANEVYAPSADDVAFYAGMIEAFEKAEAEGIAAISYEGHHIDYAHVKTAREVLALHHALTENAN
ncbi:citryl-CoA lyase [Burkholderia diffusa]|uniref:Citryl-CoA lyase n=1 Tax=Burkholderia diffusa TaxID=488732 RepID=A0AAW3PB08_9BURK|nr:CoA ester lyase [Burkholderia diffusa]KWF32824.1 citryl-CoA lyase [Burkholderia diffusa]KWF38748.1 citryl-CoA lyase [Burkholderia diffusa]KWF46793.1 citryl-CoA lyase [Burkholderia diffusa]KWF50637.1 citryl-CoA lyase [Burkholderia diffusa]